jgi:nicotinate-nucleotide adenylyltransferase
MTARPPWIVAPGPVAAGLRIGLLGGSFDPAHDGHLYISRIALKGLKLDYVWWLVSPGNPLKPMPDSLPVRLTRARNVARDRRIFVTDIESRMGTRFTVDSLAALQKRFAQVDFVWLMGSDNLAQFSRWRRWQQIAAQAFPSRWCAVQVPCWPRCMRRWRGALGCRGGWGHAPSLVVLDGPRSMESSTRLRELALGAAAEAVLNLVP